MAHEVKLKLHTKVVASKDMEVVVRESSGKLGTLLISKGNIEWRPAWKSVKKHRLSWGSFADLMKEHGKLVKG
jgi:hypothetical protein